MAFFKCKMCGGELEIAENVSVIECEYCGTKQTLPRLDDERRANMYERANHFRRNNEFDKAMGVYEQILGEDTTDAEAYWSLVLCRYGIEYVEDPDSHRHIPTVNRAQFTSIFDDENYQAALRYSDALQRGIYEAEAEAINEIQKGILEISQKEEPFDVFICYKETDNRGQRTIDSVIAQDIYEQLTKINLKVFFARMTLEKKLGSAYEPYIFAALNSAKVMLVVGTKPDHFNAVWVKNEWSRYLQLVSQSRGDKLLIPVYKDMDPYRLPKEFAHLQAQDMNKIGFMQDLIHGIKKVVGDNPAFATLNTQALLERMNGYLEEKDWENAEEYAERVLDLDPKIAEAHVGLLLIDLKLTNRSALGKCEESFEANKNYKKAIRYANEDLLNELKGYLSAINDRKAKEAEERRLAEEKRRVDEANELLERERLAGLQRIKNQKIKKIILTCSLVLVSLVLLVWLAIIPAYGYCTGQYRYYINTYKVEEFTVPDGVTSIWDDAFFGCDSLRTVNIPNSVTSIGEYAFQYCSSLTTINIPDSVTSIGNCAFNMCGSLTTVNISDSVTSIGDSAFSACYSLTTVYIPDSVTIIGDYAFYNCNSLTTINIPDSVISIGDSAFENCSSLTTINIPDSVTSIGDCVFRYCDSLRTVNIPNSVTSIGDSAFAICDSLTKINIPDSVTSIGKQAFYGCISLSKVNIPDSVTSVGNWAFANCHGLSVYCEANVKPKGWDDSWRDSSVKVIWGYEK